MTQYNIQSTLNCNALIVRVTNDVYIKDFLPHVRGGLMKESDLPMSQNVKIGKLKCLDERHGRFVLSRRTGSLYIRMSLLTILFMRRELFKLTLTRISLQNKFQSLLKTCKMLTDSKELRDLFFKLALCEGPAKS